MGTDTCMEKPVAMVTDINIGTDMGACTYIDIVWILI